MSDYSHSKIKRILLRSLKTDPSQNKDFSEAKHLIFDGKYLFGRKYCLLVIMDAKTNKPVSGIIAKAENQINMMSWLNSLKQQGLDPVAVTTDGKQTAITAFRSVWPSIVTQRCLFHIKLQIQAWVRTKPKYESSKAIARLAGKIDQVKTRSDIEDFKDEYSGIKVAYKDELNGFRSDHPIQSDTLRAYSLLKNALPYCFFYLEDSSVVHTSNALEGYFKQIQNIKGFKHCGLTEDHLFKFITWKLYFDG